jgi:tetratricopeptide (TPR) repeat protein
MSKQRKEQQKKKKREKVRKERLNKYREMLAARGRDDGFVEHIHDLLKKDDYETAREMLLEYIERFPKIARPYFLLAKVCAEIDDLPGMFWAAEQLLEVGERTFEDYMMYSAACMLNGLSSTTVECDKQMQRRFQTESDPDIVAVREEILAMFKNDAALQGDDLTPYSDEQLLDLMQRHEKANLYLGSQRFDLAIRHCDKLITRYPFFRSSYNNKALAVMLDQGPEAAEPLLQEAFEHHPDNLFAIVFKIRQLALLGRQEELPEYCERLAAVPLILPHKADIFAAKIEAFAWADDLERVIKTYDLAINEAGEDWDITSRNSYTQATHYAAVALARLGDSEAAIELWKSIPPGVFDTADENLEDIQKPIGEQNGPWFFDHIHWMPKRLFDTIRQESKRHPIRKDMDEEERTELIVQNIKPIFKKAFVELPSLERTLAEMLKRGSSTCRAWVRMLLPYCSSPELKTAVLDFASGDAGSDDCRNEFVISCSKLDWLPSKEIQFWKDGEEITIRTFSQEIHWEVDNEDSPLSEKGLEKLYEASEALKHGNHAKSIKLFKELIDEEPKAPSVLYNLSLNYLILGAKDKYDEIIDKLVQEFPDYLFGQTALAQRLIKQGQLDEGWEIVKTLQESPRLHGSEFKALSCSQILYYMAKGEMDTARQVQQNAVQIYGEDFPSLEHMQRELTR